MFTKLVRIGRDSELRYTPNQKAVCTVAVAFDVGFGDNKRTTWIEGALWGKKAESLAQYLVKGQQAVITYDDLEIEQYEHNGKHGAKLKARIVDVKLCGGRSAGKVQHQSAPAQQPTGADDFDDDIPF